MVWKIYNMFMPKLENFDFANRLDSIKRELEEKEISNLIEQRRVQRLEDKINKYVMTWFDKGSQKEVKLRVLDFFDKLILPKVVDKIKADWANRSKPSQSMDQPEENRHSEPSVEITKRTFVEMSAKKNAPIVVDNKSSNGTIDDMQTPENLTPKGDSNREPQKTSLYVEKKLTKEEKEIQNGIIKEISYWEKKLKDELKKDKDNPDKKAQTEGRLKAFYEDPYKYVYIANKHRESNGSVEPEIERYFELSEKGKNQKVPLPLEVVQLYGSDRRTPLKNGRFEKGMVINGNTMNHLNNYFKGVEDESGSYKVTSMHKNYTNDRIKFVVLEKSNGEKISINADTLAKIINSEYRNNSQKELNVEKIKEQFAEELKKISDLQMEIEKNNNRLAEIAKEKAELIAKIKKDKESKEKIKYILVEDRTNGWGIATEDRSDYWYDKDGQAFWTKDKKEAETKLKEVNGESNITTKTTPDTIVSDFTNPEKIEKDLARTPKIGDKIMIKDGEEAEITAINARGGIQYTNTLGSMTKKVNLPKTRFAKAIKDGEIKFVD